MNFASGAALTAIACGFAVFVAAGDALGSWIAPSLRRTTTGRVGIALVLGPGVVAFTAFVANLCRVPFSRPLSVALAIAAFAAWAIARSKGPAVTATESQDESDRTTRVRRILFVALVLGPVVLGFLFAATTPPYKDALVNWSYKSKILWHDGTVFSDDFQLENRHLYHPNYPLLVPLAEVFLYGLAGTADDPLDRLAKGFLALPHLGISLVILAFLSRRSGRVLALALTTLVAATPHFYKADLQFRFAGSVPSGYGDPMFASLVALVVVALASWLTTRERGDLVLASTALGLAIFTKNEALPFTLAIASAWAVALGCERSRGIWKGLPDPRSAAIAFCAFCAFAIPWLAFRHTLPERDENYQQLLTLDNLRAGAWRWPSIVVFAIESAFASDTYGLVWILLPIALVFSIRRGFDPPVVLAGVAMLAMIVVYAAVFVVTPLPIVDSLVTSIPRTFFHLTPLAVVLVGMLASPPNPDRESM